MDPAATADLAAVFVALYAGHQVADHWIQTQHQADHKGLPGWVGRWNCAKHVATYGATQLAALALVAVVTGLDLSPVPLAAGMAVNLVSHYIADRRAPLRWLADRLRKNPAWLEKGGGLYALDQSWHVGFLFLSALIIVA
ncbi:transcriptional regulator [Micromonospora tulbaghiae]|uniref:transcriptional regulator n=1 Tax=Micromonospora tulbaghiae TaxID=479978 RepID=UPI0033D6D310